MATPTLKDLYAEIRADMESKLGVSIPVFGKVFLNVLAAVQAGRLKLLWLAVASIKKNVFVDTADYEANGGTLERFGRVKLGREPFAATQGLYSVEVTGTIGATIPALTTFKSNDDSSSPGKIFQLDSEHELVSSPDTIQIRALEAGTESQLQVGDLLTSTSPLLNVDDEVEVTSEDEAPLAAEDLEEYRDKVIAAFQTEAQGGSVGDYRLWAQDAQGVLRVYPYAKSGECAEIDLYVEATVADSLDGKGTPTSAILEEVEEVIELDPDTTKPINERGRRPLGVFQIHFLAITPLDVDIEITNPEGFDAATEAAVEAALSSLISSIRPFIEAAEPLADKNDILDVNRVISTVQGVLTGAQKFDSLTLEVDGAPVTTSVQFGDGDIPVLNSVTYTP